MFEAVIIEDEQDGIDALRFTIETFCPDVSVVGEARNVDEGIDLLKLKKPQILFLDIQIGNRLGFEVLDELDGPTPLVIFTTSYQNYSIQALRAEAIDYLLKPIDPDDLITAIERCKKKILQSEKGIKEEGKELKPASKIGVPTSDGIEIISLANVLRFEASNNYTYIFFEDKKKMLVSRTLKAFESILSGDHFVRVHQSHLVNVEFIKSYQKNNTGFLLLQKDIVVPIGRSYRSTVKELISRLYPSI